jgi:uncharacterized RDD family membrane protein YckC
VSTALSAPQQYPAAPPEQTRCPDWKEQLAERLDAYRAKHPETISPTIDTNRFADSRASRIARSVASRYAAAPSYSELLIAAAEAERAAQDELDRQRAAEKIAAHPSDAEPSTRNMFHTLDAGQDEALPSAAAEEAFRERYGSSIHTQPATPVMPEFAARSREMHLHQSTPEPEPSLEDLLASALVEPRALLPSKLIEFPRELVSTCRARPRLPEDPTRETSAATQRPEPAQLRIFEVQPETEPTEVAAIGQTEATASESVRDSQQASSEVAAQSNSEQASQSVRIQNTIQSPRPATQGILHKAGSDRISANPGGLARGPVKMARPTSGNRAQQLGGDSRTSAARVFKGLEWAAISLDKEPAVGRRSETSVADYVPFLVDPASIDRRVMAFAVDFAVVTAGFLGFLTVFVASTPHLPAGVTAVVLASAVYLSLWVLYQMLFFSLSGATAGMLYARIALCTFGDQNPTRPALRRRLAAWWLSCLPVGMGFLWCFVDEDNLSWHDRITRTYQRGY